MKYLLSIFIAFFMASAAVAQFPSNWDDATYIALWSQEELAVPQSTIDLVAAERGLIEAAFPDMSDIWVFREWEPGWIRCGLTEEGWTQYHSGGLQQLRDVIAENACVQWGGSTEYRYLEFRSVFPLHSERLAELFSVVEGVRYAEAYTDFCCDGSSIEVSDFGPPSRYVYRLAWGDCMMGCYASHYWEYQVSGTSVTLESEWGAVSNEGQSWGSVKAMYR